MHLTDKQIEDYKNLGVIIIKDVFKDWIEPLRSGFQKVLNNPSKHGREKIEYMHPLLEKVLKETYGIIVYQDQVLLIAQSIAGYSLGDADRFRKAMGKKIAQVMIDEKDKFIQGAITKGFTQQLGEKVFELIEPLASPAHKILYPLLVGEPRESIESVFI